jgi:hypothetical protein
MNRLGIGAALVGVAGMLAGSGAAQEVKQDKKAVAGAAQMAPVTQHELDTADKSAANFAGGGT